MKKIIVFTMVAAALTIFNACQKDEELYEENPYLAEEQVSQYNEGQMILGEKLKNPYSVENMQKAYNNLRADNKLKSAVNIETTHFYVRFRPKSFQELNMLTRDTTLHIYDYPLDVEIKRGGTHYHDPSIPQNQITWQYTVVPVDYTFPNIQYQKLADLFLQEETGELEELKSGSIDYFDWLTLETEALRITDNLDENKVNGVELKSTSWRPAGTIRVYDDIIDSYSTTQKVFDHYEYYNCETGEPIHDPYGEDPFLKSLQPPDDEICQRAVYRYETNTTNSHFIPLEGITVRARRWFTTHEGMTDANGDFTCDGTFVRDANYSIKWEKGYYDIRNGDLVQAYFNGPKQTGEWNLAINAGGESIMYATIHRAAYRHFYGDNLGLPRPILPFGNKTKICYIDQNGGGVFWGDWSAGGILPDIRVFGKWNNQYKTTERVFGTTTHELGHQLHSLYMGNIQYWQVNKVIYESWAEAVEWALTEKEYRGYGNSNYTYQRGKQDWRRSDPDWEYSPVFIDLVDDFNQRNSGVYFDLYHVGSINYPNDEITGYSLSYIVYNLLDEVYGLGSLTESLKNHKITGVTDENIDVLLELY
ncbi:hypothetical protein [Tangfeifania diversioriginum]|nr:hypothetical protein [Tangfeifania diversioriginum]